MSLPAAAVWEIRPTNGVDTNGGAFVAGSVSGTDWSQQATPHVAFDGSTISATTVGVSATITITGYVVATGDVDNFVQITGGTNFTAGIYRIASVSTGANTWTLDRNAATGAGLAMVGNMGGALKTLSKVDSVAVAGNLICVKAEATISVGSTTTMSTVQTGTVRVVGYTSSRTDGGRVTIQNSAGAYYGLTISGRYYQVENFIFDANAQTNGGGCSADANNSFINCIFKNFNGTRSGLILSNSYNSVINCEVTGGTGGSTTYGISTATGYVDIFDCNIHDNTCTGIFNGSGSDGSCSSIVNNLITNNTGDGIKLNATLTANKALLVLNNTIHGNGNGINFSQGSRTVTLMAIIKNNLITSNTTYGYAFSNGVAAPSSYLQDGNCYWNNGTDKFNNADLTGANAVVPYANLRDVILTADPYTAKASNDYTLNSNAGGGAAAKSVGIPSTTPNNTQTSYPDFGAYQHLDPATIIVKRTTQQVKTQTQRVRRALLPTPGATVTVNVPLPMPSRTKQIEKRVTVRRAPLLLPGASVPLPSTRVRQVERRTSTTRSRAAMPSLGALLVVTRLRQIERRTTTRRLARASQSVQQVPIIQQHTRVVKSYYPSKRTAKCELFANPAVVQTVLVTSVRKVR